MNITYCKSLLADLLFLLSVLYKVCNLKHNPTIIMCYRQQINSETGSPSCNRLPTSSMTLKSRSPRLLGYCLCQLHKSCASANMVYSRAECALILKHYFTSKSFAAILDAFNEYSDMEVPNQTIHQLVAKFKDT
jgi:hypothetical protein